MANSKITSQDQIIEDVVERNIKLTGQLIQYFLAEPHLFEALPDNFELIILPDDDPEMRH